VVVTGNFQAARDWAELLGDARVQALEKERGDSVYVRSELDPKGADGTVRVIYGPVGHDTDPPVLKVDSDPKKGTVVYPGQTITVTIKASEHYRDGHQSWPSGVREIQLLDDAGLVKSWDYGMRPPPCAVPTETWPYTVPANPPAVVHLKVETQSAGDLAYSATKTADFPTGDWYGTLKTHNTGPTINTFAIVEFAFDAAADGTVKGRGRAKVSFSPQAYSFGGESCTYSYKVTPDEFDVDIGGRRDGGQFNLEISTSLMGNYEITTSATPGQRPCNGGGSQTGRVKGKMFNGFGSAPDFARPHVAAQDGANNSVTTPSNGIPGGCCGPYGRTTSIEIHQAKSPPP
jgi:hypothetical protein